MRTVQPAPPVSASHARGGKRPRAARTTTRRPIEPHETPHLERLGRTLRRLRLQAGLSQRAFGELAELSCAHVSFLEGGIARTRRSTLGRIASALAGALPLLGDADALADALALEAGPALAAESIYCERVEKRRVSRWKRKRRRADAAEYQEHRLLVCELRSKLRALRLLGGYRRGRR
jgi:transcriptional regulator with XRE-family HTH domain